MISLSPSSAIAIIATIVFIIIIYRKLLKPYKQYSFYRKIITSSYKSLVYPYSIFGLGFFGIFRRDFLKHGDSQYTIKHQYPSYQVSLSNFSGKVYIDLIDPSLIKQFYEKQMQGCYVKSLLSPSTSSLKDIIGNGLVFSEGEEWKMKRKIMSHAFNYDFIKSKITLIARICQEKIREDEEIELNRNKSEVKINLSNLFQRIFGNVVIKSFFGDIQLDDLQGVQVFSYIKQMFELNSKRAFSPFAFFIGPNFSKYKLRSIDNEVSGRNKKFQEFATNIILNQVQKVQKERLSDSGNKFQGIIQQLIKQNKLKVSSPNQESQQVKNYYTTKDLIDEFKTFFTAGMQTTASSASMMIYLLAQHPAIEEKLRKQINTVFPLAIDFRDITYEKLKKLVYFDDVMKETLRMYCPTTGLFSREVVKDHYIGSIPVKQGTLVGVKLIPNQFKQEFYGMPHLFNPERWSAKDPTKYEQYSYFPFSSGRRNCIGQHLALLQSKIAIVFLLKRYCKITLEKPFFRKYMRTFYGAQEMITTLQKNPKKQ